jgi:hypothetical protein
MLSIQAPKPREKYASFQVGSAHLQDVTIYSLFEEQEEQIG